MNSEKIYLMAITALLALSCSKDDGPMPNKTEPKPENRPPEAFTLTSPEDGAEKAPLRPEFSWQAATDPDGDAVAYDLLLGEGSEPDSLVAKGILETKYTPKQDLQGGTDYRWQVVAKDGKGGEKASGVFAFTATGPVNLKDAQKLQTQNPFLSRENHASVIFNDQMFVLGGFGNGTALNDFLFSTDGIDWVQPPSMSEYTARFFHRAVVFQDAIWIAGGLASDFENDVWRSNDGVGWTSLAQEQPYVTRAEHTLTAYDDRLWLVGGNNGSGKLADVWSSSDGKNWQLEIVEAPFGKRNFHQTVSFKGKLWLIGGFQGNDPKNDVWSSTDGKQWEEVTPNAAFSPRAFHQVLVFDDKLWVIGSGTDNDIWYSEDGVDWIEATPENSFEPKNGFTALYYKNAIWILGGSSTNEVWRINVEIN